MLYLKKRESGIFCYRRPVPKELQACVGMKIFRKSLKTRDFEKAKEAWKIIDTQIDQLFQKCRNGKIVRSVLSDKAIASVASNHGAALLERDQTVRIGGYAGLSPMERFPFWESDEDIPITSEQAVFQQKSQCEVLIDELKNALIYDTYEYLDVDVEERILKSLKKEGFKGKPSAKVMRPFAEAELKVQEGILARCTGESVPTPVLVPVNKHLLSIEAEKWSELKLQRGEWKPKTAQSFLASMRLFIEVRGDKDISEYIKDDARKFQSVLVVYPANVWKYPELQSMTPKQIVAQGMKPMSKNNASKIFVFVGSFFRYALKSYDTMEANPFQGQSIKKEDNSDSRVPYTVDELNILFASPLFSGVKTKVYCNIAGDVSMRDTGRFWLPLISLFTGMRMNEIAQIQRSDIRHESGFLIFDLCKGKGKDFKTKSSLRHIPVHHELLKCGLLQVRDAGESDRIFPEMTRGKDGTYSYTFSKWYGRFLNGIGIKRSDLVFHSFRHVFEEAAMRTGMQDSMVDSLQGHKLDKMKAVYVQNVDLQMKNEFVQKIRYEGLDLSHIYV